MLITPGESYGQSKFQFFKLVISFRLRKQMLAAAGGERGGPNRRSHRMGGGMAEGRRSWVSHGSLSSHSVTPDQGVGLPRSSGPGQTLG